MLSVGPWNECRAARIAQPMILKLADKCGERSLLGALDLVPPSLRRAAGSKKRRWAVARNERGTHFIKCGRRSRRLARALPRRELRVHITRADVRPTRLTHLLDLVVYLNAHDAIHLPFAVPDDVKTAFLGLRILTGSLDVCVLLRQRSPALDPSPPPPYRSPLATAHPQRSVFASLAKLFRPWEREADSRLRKWITRRTRGGRNLGSCSMPRPLRDMIGPRTPCMVLLWEARVSTSLRIPPSGVSPGGLRALANAARAVYVDIDRAETIPAGSHPVALAR